MVESQLVRTYAQATGDAARAALRAVHRIRSPSATTRSVGRGTDVDRRVPHACVYPDGYRVEVSGGTVTSAAPNSGRLTVLADGIGEVTVRDPFGRRV